MVINNKTIEIATTVVGLLATFFVREFLERRAGQRY